MKRDRLISVLTVAVAMFAATAQAEPDPQAGETVFRACKACHQIGEGAKNRVGPHLNDLNGRTAGTLDGFRYSKAMQDAGAQGLVWTDETLDAFLADPKSYVPKTKMGYRGLKDPQDRVNLIAYLARFSPDAVIHPSNAGYDLDPAILAIKGDVEYGEYLSGDCKTCHQADGSVQGMPSITGWPEEDFIVAMHAYKNKSRTHPVMQMMAGRLTNEEIAALAAYFGGLQ